MKESRLIALCFLATIGCTPVSRMKPEAATPTMATEFAVQSPLAGPKREKVPPAEASSPSRGLDVGDPTGGRLTLVEMHRMAMRENESLKSDLRSRDQQIAEASSSREAFRARSVELEAEIQKMKKGYEEATKENQDLKAQLIEAAIRVADLEKQLLQIKIDLLKARKPVPAPKVEKKVEPSVEPSGEKDPKENH